MATPPLWQASIIEQLEVRARTHEAPFEALINACMTVAIQFKFVSLVPLIDVESLQREEAAVDEQHSLAEQLERAQEALQVARAQLELHSSGIVDSKKYQELDNKYKQLKTERLELLHTQSQNTHRLLQLNEQLQEQHTLRTRLEADLKAIRAQLDEQGRQSQHREALLEEKNVNIQVLQDELQALQLELLQTDERAKALQNENNQLVHRWLSKVNETVDRLNAEVSSSSLLPGPESASSLVATSTTTNLHTPVTGLVCSDNGNLLFFSTAATANQSTPPPILSRGLLTTLSLSVPHEAATPKKAIFSRDSDLLIGRGASEAELVQIWSVSSGKVTGQLAASIGRGFLDMCTLPSTNDAIISVHELGLMRLYDLPRTFCLWTERMDSVCHQVLSLGPDLVAVLSGTSIHTWDIRLRGRLRSTPSSLPPLNLIAADSRDGQGALLAATNRASLLSLSPSTLRANRTIELPASASHIACHGSHFLAACKSKLVLGDHTTGTIISTFSDHDYPIVGIGFMRNATSDDQDSADPSQWQAISVDASGIVKQRRIVSERGLSPEG